MRISGSIAIVTGASSGIGEAIAVEFARRGATVIGVARRAEALEAVIARCRRMAPESLALAGDVSNRADCEAAVNEAVKRFGRIDIVVNNAGVSKRKPAAETAVEEIEAVMAINFFGAVYTTMAALPHMLEAGRGSVVNISSVAGALPNPKESAYAASKAALAMWSHGLNVDLAGTGVHVAVVSPGPIDTEIWSKDENPAAYRGKLHPPQVVATGVARAVEKRIDHSTVPRIFGIPGAIYPLLGRPMRWGLRRFDERARARR